MILVLLLSSNDFRFTLNLCYIKSEEVVSHTRNGSRMSGSLTVMN